MFSKLLYGRVLWSSWTNDDNVFREQGYGCYGNWELNLVWQDLLQGKISHSVESF